MNLSKLIASAEVTASLGLGSKQVTQPVVATDWVEDDDGLSSTLVFGPYPKKARFDQVLVALNGDDPDGMRVLADGGVMELPAGFEFEYRLSIESETRQAD